MIDEMDLDELSHEDDHFAVDIPAAVDSSRAKGQEHYVPCTGRSTPGIVPTADYTGY